MNKEGIHNKTSSLNKNSHKCRKIIRNTRGIELSVNFIVATIIGMVLFIFGVILFKNMINVGTSSTEYLDQQSQRDIQEMLMRGDRVALPLRTVTISPGESHVFGLGLLNAYDSDKKFTIRIHQTSATDKLGNPIATVLLFEEDIQDAIKSKEQKIIPLIIKAPRGAKRGTYELEVRVYYCDNPVNPCIPLAPPNDEQMLYDQEKVLTVTVA
ncbi:hypothetical protein COY95_03205 [Candidatus Woesearchaeota archaeon CG_4_10_14_0_8_um_filter_47_5]|nr:MAG: hypothetical protein COY95_03205 [Candidatus Woesearchaeota archaeon CG_4_10_14_0_8_um_filter_47_5]